MSNGYRTVARFRSELCRIFCDGDLKKRGPRPSTLQIRTVVKTVFRNRIRMDSQYRRPFESGFKSSSWGTWIRIGIIMSADPKHWYLPIVWNRKGQSNPFFASCRIWSSESWTFSCLLSTVILPGVWTIAQRNILFVQNVNSYVGRARNLSSQRDHWPAWRRRWSWGRRRRRKTRGTWSPPSPTPFPTPPIRPELTNTARVGSLTMCVW